MNRADIIGAESFERGQRVEFWKMNGAGNDFIILNNLVEKLPESALPRSGAAALCERHLSIGADGLMVVDAARGQAATTGCASTTPTASLGEMCGNGARCICRYGYENGLAGEKQTVETTAGIVTGRRHRPSGSTASGSTIPPSSSWTAAVEAEGVGLALLLRGAGEPRHPPRGDALGGDLRSVDEGRLREIGRALRHHPAFPKGANVNFYEITGRGSPSMSAPMSGAWRISPTPAAPAPAASVTVLTLQGKVCGQAVYGWT